MKRLLLSLLLVMAPFAAHAQYATTPDGNGGVIITGYSPNTVTTLNIPPMLNEAVVTGIASSAFANFASLTSVTMPDSVTSIGSDAFQNCALMTSVTFGNGLTSIGDEAFYDCQSLGVVMIPNNVTSIGQSAFYDCANMTNLTIGTDVMTIADQAFEGCESLTTVTIPNSVISIGQAAFYGCTLVTTVTFGSGLTTIGDEAFFDCESLTSVTIPAGVTSIGVGPFDLCLSLTSITVASSNLNYSSSMDGVLFNKALTTIIQCPAGKTGSYSIPAGVTTVQDESFYGCESLTSVTIPNSVTSIGQYAFQACTDITSVMIGTGVTSIGQFAFGSCTSLGSVTLPAGVTTIGESAFSYCSTLPNVTIPNSVTSIGSYAFQACTGLTNVTIGSGVTTIGQYAFYACSDLTSALFNGNAPTMGQSVFESTANGFTVSFYGGTTGFTTPHWTDSSGDIYATIQLQTLQSITFPAIATQVYPSDPLTLTATASSGLAVTFSLVSGPAMISGDTLTLTGTGTVIVQASQAGNASYMAATSVNQSFMVAQTESVSDWETKYSITNLNATPFGDSMPNLLKYLFDINPTVTMTSASRAALPALGTDTTTTPGTTYLTLTFREYALASGITVNVQNSLDLQTWTTVTPDITKQTGTDSNTGDPIMEVEVKVTASKQFIRLNVTSP